jgi:hypothetical protein
MYALYLQSTYKSSQGFDASALDAQVMWAAHSPARSIEGDDRETKLRLGAGFRWTPPA